MEMIAKQLLTKPFGDLSVVSFLLRAILGVVFFAHGAQKVLGWFGGYGLTGTVGFFESALGIPAPLAYIAAFTEFFGGLAMLIGLLTRIWAIGFIVNMLVAMFVVHLPYGFFLNTGTNGGSGVEFVLTLCVLSIVALLLGPGRYSLDYLIFARTEQEPTGQVSFAK